MTVTNNEIGAFINAQTEDTTPDTAADFLLSYDASAAAVKKLKISTVGGAAGAPTTSKYITAAADAGLSAEIAIPGLAGSPDIAGSAGAGTSEEYDTATTGLTWDVAPATVDSNTTIKSHLYVVNNAGQHQGTKAWSPAGAFDARAKVMMSNDWGTNAADIGLLVGNSDLSTKAFVGIHRTAAATNFVATAYTYASSSYTQRGTDIALRGNDLYVRLTRDGSNNLTFWWSTNGLLWVKIVTQALTLTVAKLGFRISGDASPASSFAVDWLRTDV